MTDFPRWQVVRGGIVAGAGGEEAVAEARQCNQVYIDGHRLAEEQQASPLARRIYDLRHACLSGWLNVGVPPTQVAKWAGHRVDEFETMVTLSGRASW